MNAATCFSQREACEWQRGCLDPCVGIQSTRHLARNQHSESDTMDVLQTFIVVFGIMDRVCTKVHYLAEFLGRDVFTAHEWGLLDVVWSTVQCSSRQFVLRLASLTVTSRWLQIRGVPSGWPLLGCPWKLLHRLGILFMSIMSCREGIGIGIS